MKHDTEKGEIATTPRTQLFAARQERRWRRGKSLRPAVSEQYVTIAASQAKGYSASWTQPPLRNPRRRGPSGSSGNVENSLQILFAFSLDPL